MNRRVGIVFAGAIATGLLLGSVGLVAQAEQSSVQVACTAPAWAEGVSYSVGAKVTYQNRLYEARAARTPRIQAPAGTRSRPRRSGSTSARVTARRPQLPRPPRRPRRPQLLRPPHQRRRPLPRRLGQ